MAKLDDLGGGLRQIRVDRFMQLREDDGQLLPNPIKEELPTIRPELPRRREILFEQVCSCECASKRLRFGQ
jgi:hypothetical protein